MRALRHPVAGAQRLTFARKAGGLFHALTQKLVLFFGIGGCIVAILAPLVFMLAMASALSKTVGYQFLNASAWNDHNGPLLGFSVSCGSTSIDLAA